jgi:hypothetical protein
MTDHVLMEIVGFSDGPCGPFPCDDTRTCELERCAPSENLEKAYFALQTEIAKEYGERVEMKLTWLDEQVPDYIMQIVEEHQPPLPIILINGKLVPIGRISLPLIREALNAELT